MFEVGEHKNHVAKNLQHRSWQMFQRLLFLSLAGAAGTLARYGLSGIVQKNTMSEFPFGTMVVNIVGCLLFGLVWALAQNRLSITPELRAAMFIGFFGAFTTFSSFVFESRQLLDESQWLWASYNILGQNVAGIVAMIIGLAVGKLI
jgi:CrcB protein